MSSSPINTNNIDNLKNYLNASGGLQRSNRYSVKIYRPELNDLPNGPQSSSYITVYPSEISFGARATNYIYDGLQGYNYGRAVPNSTKFVGGIVMTFYVTGDLFVLNYFNDWFDAMYNKKNNSFFVPWYTETVQPANLQLTYLDLNGNQSISTNNQSLWTFQEVYPVEAMPIQLSAKADSPLLYQVVMNYRSITRSSIL
jgi:hypothetical protein